jgi:sugar phosphate isomerase/epimerase
MRLAISNLAWPREADPAVAELLHRLGVPGVELAPTKVWPQPLAVSDREVADCRRFWEQRQIQIVALQSLLFGRAELQLFGDAGSQVAMLAHLGGMCRLAQLLGARVLVFGSPKNRRREQLTETEAEVKACDFFRRLGDIAEAHHVVIGIEPNPVEYGCDFLTTGAAAARFVERVQHPAIALHLDTACLALAGESPGLLLASHGRLVRHFHISEPRLQPIHTNTLDHALLARQIRSSGYSGWVSIEMQSGNAFDEEALEASVAFVQQLYLSAAKSQAA